MAKNKIPDLIDHLFETIEMLKDGDAKMPIATAKSIADVAQTIVNAAKLELEYIRTLDDLDGVYKTSGFFIEQAPEKSLHVLDK